MVKKLTALDLVNNLTTSDLIYVVQDVNGTPVSRKGPISTLKSLILSGMPVINGGFYKQLWIGGWKPLKTGGCGDPMQLELAANKNVYDVLPFDKDTIEYSYANVPMPDDYTGGSLYFKVYWAHPATTVDFGVRWAVKGIAIDNGGNLDLSLASPRTIDDTGGNTNYLFISDLSQALTLEGSPAAGKLIQFQTYRVATNANDTLAVDAYLLGVMLYYPVGV